MLDVPRRRHIGLVFLSDLYRRRGRITAALCTDLLPPYAEEPLWHSTQKGLHDLKNRVSKGDKVPPFELWCDQLSVICKMGDLLPDAIVDLV